MTYSEAILLWIRRILLAMLLIAVIGMAVTQAVKAKRAIDKTDAYIQYLDAKYGW